MATVRPQDIRIVTSINGATARTGPVTLTLHQPIGSGLGSIDVEAGWIEARAAVTVRGTPGDDVGFWRFGFIQLKFITDDWAHYRGPSTTDGSVFLALDRPPARLQQLCRDTYVVGQGSNIPILGPILFYDGDKPIAGNDAKRMAGYLPYGTKMPSSGSLLLNILFADHVVRIYDLAQFNTRFNPKRRNNLYSLQTGAAYMTMFAMQKGVGEPIEIMKSFQWNVRCRAHFRTDPNGIIEQAPAQRGDLLDMTVSHVVDGPPTDPRFRTSALDRSLPTCNAIMETARKTPYRQMSERWEDWNVRH